MQQHSSGTGSSAGSLSRGCIPPAEGEGQRVGLEEMKVQTYSPLKSVGKVPPTAAELGPLSLLIIS